MPDSNKRFGTQRETPAGSDSEPATPHKQSTSNATNSPQQSLPATVPKQLGETFAPLLQECCGHRLGKIAWFRTDWQRGGARTGRASFTLVNATGGTDVTNTENQDEGRTVQAVVKIPVRPMEYIWNQRMQPDEEDEHGITALTYAAGVELGGYDLAWIVMERFPEGPLFGLKRKDAMELMADAATRFHRRGTRFEIDRPMVTEDWHSLFDRARESVRRNLADNQQRWRAALKTTQKKAEKLIGTWDSRPCTGWIHGDLHPANAMSRSTNPDDPAMLIDLAEVRPGHWIEDAVYLERLYWVKKSYLEKHPPVQLIKKRHKELNLNDTDHDITMLADVRRALLAATAPAFLKSEGNPVYLTACLEILEQVLQRI